MIAVSIALLVLALLGAPLFAVIAASALSVLFLNSKRLSSFSLIRVR